VSLISTTVTYLEMRAPPDRAPVPPPHDGVVLVHARRPNVAYYRFLCNTVGAPWLWVDRRRLDDAQLASILDDPRVEVHVAMVDGVPAGYAELDRRAEVETGDVELAYFGLMPSFIGRGLGPWLLDAAIRRAFTTATARRLWVHTQTLDHPKALPLYRALGFVPYKTEEITVDAQLISR
jgi:GNAT superfamily N-acetyltransferase